MTQAQVREFGRDATQVSREFAVTESQGQVSCGPATPGSGIPGTVQSPEEVQVTCWLDDDESVTCSFTVTVGARCLSLLFSCFLSAAASTTTSR